jgi:hypothetical protein
MRCILIQLYCYDEGPSEIEKERFERKNFNQVVAIFMNA